MSEEARVECQLRRRRSAGPAGSGPDLPLNLQVGYRVAEGGPARGTPSPCTVKFIPSTRDKDQAAASTSLAEFRKKQQSFEIQIEDCDEEEMVIESEGEEEGEAPATADRPVTPMPLHDYGSVTYTEGPQPLDYLQVKLMDNDCLTDVSDADSEGNDEA